MNQTLFGLLQAQVRSRPAAAALVWRDSVVTYGELYRRVERLAAALAQQLPPGARVAVLSRNRPEYIELLYAAPAAGLVLVPLNIRLAPLELRRQMQQTGVSLLFGEPELLSGLPPDTSSASRQVAFGADHERWLAQAGQAPLPAVSGREPAWLLFTSGTTGSPKAAMLSQRSLLAALEAAAWGRPVRPDDRYLYPFPLFHISAHNVLLQHRHGAAVVLLPGFDAQQVIHACRKQSVTTLSLAPTMLAMLLDHPAFEPDVLASVRSIGYGASAMPATLLQRVMAVTGAGLSQGYGMTELSGNVAFLDADAHRRAAGGARELLASAGRPAPGVELYLRDEAGNDVAAGECGEIVVRGPQVMLGYWEQPEATAAVLVDGWLHTGDVGRFDAGGYLYIVDRKKDMIITGGENVASREVEDVLCRFPGVAAAAVVGIPAPTWGEQVCALVVPRAGASLTTQELLDHCRCHLGGYKTPRWLLLAANLPVNASGKVDKKRVREMLLAGDNAVPGAPAADGRD